MRLIIRERTIEAHVRYIKLSKIRLFLGYSDLATQKITQRGTHYELQPMKCPYGCPPSSYCDNGICRCRPKLMALHGTCWKHHEGVIEGWMNLNFLSYSFSLAHKFTFKISLDPFLLKNTIFR